MNKQPNLTQQIAAIFSVFLLLCFTSIKAQTLQPGDMAVIGWNALADKVHIVTLVNIQAGTVIKVTDRGWDQSTNAFTTSTIGDGIVTWTPSSVVPAGTVLELFLGGADDGTALINLTASTVLTTDIAVQGYTVNDAMLISGDQVFIYQGNDSNPRFIFGMNNSSGTVDATNWNTSIAQTLRDAMIPNGTGSQNALTNGINAIGLPGGAAQRDNVQYVGPTTTADRNTWLARMANLSNWSGSDLNDITNPVTSATTPIVNIASSNNSPTDIALSNASVNQSAGINAEVGTLTTTDPDAGNTFTYTFISGAGDTHNTSFNISGSSLRANNAAAMPAGTYSVRIQTDDQHGGTFPKFFTITVVDDVAPTISSVAVPANSTYRTGQNLDFTVNVSEYVTVTGTPQLPLAIGSASVNAFYQAGGSTAAALLFRHTVQPGETDADGITVGASLDLNSGTITDGAGLPLTLTLNSVGSTTGVLVDGIAPSVTGVDVPGDDTYALGETLSFTVNFNENVVVNTTGGNPRIPLTIGTNTRYATYVSNPVSDALLFTYTVVAGDNDTDGISVGTHIELNGSAIQDIAGNAALLTLNAIGATNGVRVDAQQPAVNISSDKTSLKAGEIAILTFTLSEPSTDFEEGDVTVTGGILSDFSGSGTSYSATFTPTDNVTVTATIDVDAGTFTDAAGNGNTAAIQLTIAVDTQRPTATIVVADDVLNIGETTLVTITFNEIVTGLTNADLTVPNGILSPVSTSDGGVTWMATFTPADDTDAPTNVITLDNTGVIDAVGNAGIGTSSSDNFIIRTNRLTFVVTTDSDAGDDATTAASLIADEADGGGLSLREALYWARNGDTVTFAPGISTIILGGSPVVVTKNNLTIDGDVNDDGSPDVTISGNNTSRVMQVIGFLDGVELIGLTLTGGRGSGGGGGLSIGINTSLTLRNSSVINNQENGWGGGGIYGSTVTLKIINSNISGNSSDSFGGGIRIVGPSVLHMINSTVNNNTSTGSSAHGGGIQYAGPDLLIVNSTISGNAAMGPGSIGGGLRISSGNATTVYNSTIVGNAASDSGGGVSANGTTDTFVNTVIAGNTSGAGAVAGVGGSPLATGGSPNDVAGTIEIGTHNFFGTNATLTTNNNNLNNQGTANLLLGNLMDNGGHVNTHKPQPRSALIGAGSVANLPADTYDLDGDGDTGEALPIDATGGMRAPNGTVDIGAVETRYNQIPVVTTSGGVTTFTEPVDAPPVPVTVDPGLAVVDPDNSTLVSATISITGNFYSAEDELAFVNDGSTMGNITGSYVPATGALTLTSADATATLAQWQSALRAVTYSNSSKTPSTANRTITFVVNDGEGDSTPATKTVSVTAVNDAPEVTAPATISVTEDMPSTIIGISFSDADAGTGNVTVIFSVPSGTLNAITGGGVTVGGTSSAMTLSGSISNINAFIAGSNVSFTTAANATANVTLTVSINDGGNTGSGGALSASETVTLQVAAVNDAPTVTAPGSIAIIEDIPGALTGISFADVDAGNGNVTVTFSVPSGTLHATTGGGVTVGGTASALTLTGSITDINAFIAASGVSFTTASNATANITLTVSINDGGNTGSGGAQTDTSTVTLTVTAVNDPPTIVVPASIEVVEDVATALTGISFDDVDAGAGNVEVTFGIPSDRGELQAVAEIGIDLTLIGSHTVVLEGTVAAINAYLATGNLSFRNLSGDLNDVRLGVTIDDMGNTGNGGPQTANEEVTITVRATVPRIVQVYSSTPDGLYGIGSLIDIHVEFDREVTATEVGDGINLLLNTGVAGRSASYVSGSGTKTLAFQYTVQTGDENTNLDYLNTNAFELSTGSTIESSEADIGANLTLPVIGSGSSLSDNNQLVVDGIVPNPIAKNITLTLDANGSATLSAADLNDGSTDNLTTEGDLGLAISQTEFNCADVGSVTVTLTVTDEAGNEASTTATVAVADVTGPTVLTKNVILALGTDGLATLTAQMIDRGSNDACGIADLTVSKTQFNSSNLGINTVTLTATDHSGNQSSATATVVIVAFEDASLVYDGTPKSLTIAGELPNGIQVTYTGNGQTQAGIYTVTASIEGGSNFNDLVLTAKLEITKASLIGLITLDDASFVYDGTARSLSISGDLPNGASVSYTGNGQTDAGIYTVTADINGGNNYHSLVLNATLTINKAPQTITFVSPGTLTRDAGTVSLDVEANSNLPVTLSIDDEQIALLHGQDLEVRRLGTVIVTATQPGNHNYLPAEPVSVTIRIVNAADAALPIRVHKAVSPNGDGINDYLMIEGIRDYPENKITVFDKSGRVLAEIESYDNRDRVFTGQYVRDGTYYYYLDVKDGGQWKREKGFFVVKRTVN